MASAAALGSHLSGGRINLAQVREAARSDLRDCLANCPQNKVQHRLYHCKINIPCVLYIELVANSGRRGAFASKSCGRVLLHQGKVYQWCSILVIVLNDIKELGVTKLLRLPCPTFDDAVKTTENVVFLIKPQKRIVEGALEALRYSYS